MSHELIAPCGIDCSACKIHRAKSEPEVMKAILDYFKKERNKDLAPEQIDCDGCLGDRSRHWSGDCGILKCAVDERKLETCSDCGEFPCERLEKWAQGDAGHAKAFGRLREMRDKK